MTEEALILPGLSEAMQKIQPAIEGAIQTPKDLSALVDRLMQVKTIALDTETTGLDIPTLELVGISLALSETESYYIPVGHISLDRQLPTSAVIGALRPALERDDLEIRLWNADYDLCVLRKYGINPKISVSLESQSIQDGQIQIFILNEMLPKSLKTRAKADLGMTMTRFEDVGKRKSSDDDADPTVVGSDEFDDSDESMIKDEEEFENFAFISVEAASSYARDDAVATYRLCELYERKLKNPDDYMWPQYVQELLLVPTMVHMSEQGVLVDAEKAKEQYEEALRLQADYEAGAKALLLEVPAVRERLNGYRWKKSGLKKKERADAELADLLSFKSHDLKRAILYEDLGLSDEKTRTSKKSGKLSTDRWAMQAIVRKGRKPDATDMEKLGAKVCDLLLKHSKQTKMIDAFYKPLATKLIDGRIYTHFNNVGTRTGRFSCIAKGALVDVVRDFSSQPERIPIEDVKEGALVYTFDESRRLTLRPVVWSGKTGHKKVLRIHWIELEENRRGFLDLTPDHEVRLSSGRYVRASELNPGDKVLAYSRSSAGPAYYYKRAIERIEQLNVTQDVYCLEVEDTHNFIAEELCVHNCNNPNLMQMPSRGEIGKKFREIFLVAPGYKWVSVDLSQIELRIAAHLSGDESMIEAYRNDEDLHTNTAIVMGGLTKEGWDALDKDDQKLRRSFAKSIGFGILYGMGGQKLYETLINEYDVPEDQVSVEECDQKIKQYLDSKPGVRRYIAETERMARRYQFIRTIRGRKRRLPHAIDPGPSPKGSARDGAAWAEWRKNLSLYRADMRRSINSRIQGSASDLIKIVMIRVHKRIEAGEFDFKEKKCKLLLQIHDELNFECPEETAESLKEAVEYEMSRIGVDLKMLVPVKGEGAVADTWGSAHG